MLRPHLPTCLHLCPHTGPCITMDELPLSLSLMPSIWAVITNPSTTKLLSLAILSFLDDQSPRFTVSFLLAYKYDEIFFILQTTLSWPYIPLELPPHLSHFYSIKPQRCCLYLPSPVFLPFCLESCPIRLVLLNQNLLSCSSWGTSLVVQWLWIHLQSLVGELSCHMLLQLENLCTTKERSC